MSLLEIKEAIVKALNSSDQLELRKSSFLLNEEYAIEELVYIYDIHEIHLMNKKRIDLYLEILIM